MRKMELGRIQQEPEAVLETIRRQWKGMHQQGDPADALDATACTAYGAQQPANGRDAMINKEWIEINIQYGRNCDKDEDSFVNRRLDNAGTQIRLKGGRAYLIGDINQLGGSCDCCTAVDGSDIVEAYRVLVEDAEL